jgi:hypothetical protein
MRLSDISPDEVAAQVRELVRYRVSVLEQALGVHVSLETEGISQDARFLTHYAQTGEVPEGMLVSECLQRVVSVLYMTAFQDYESITDDWQRGGHPEHEIDCVVRAALARSRLALGEEIPTTWFAALAGLCVPTARAYVSRYRLGENASRRGNVAAQRAIAWLSVQKTEWGAPTSDQAVYSRLAEVVE